MIFIQCGKTLLSFCDTLGKQSCKWRRIESVYWQSWWYRWGTTYEATFSQIEEGISHTLQFISQVFKRPLLWRPVCVSGKIERIILHRWKLDLHNFSTVEYLSVKDFVTSAIFTNTFLINYKFCRQIHNLEKISVDLFSRKAKKIRKFTNIVPREN